MKGIFTKIISKVSEGASNLRELEISKKFKKSIKKRGSQSEENESIPSEEE